MARHFARIECVHVDVDVNHIRCFREPLHLAVQVRRARAHVLQCELLNVGAVEKLLLERVGVAHTHLDDVARRHGGLQTGLDPHPREALPGGDGDGHSSQHAAQRSLGSVEIAVGIDEDHRDAQRSCGGAGMLQPAEHSKNAVAVGEESDGKISAAPPFGDQLRKIAAGQREVVPRAVGLFLVGGQRHGGDLFCLDTVVFKQLQNSALFQVVRSTRNIRHIAFTHIRHLDDGHPNGSGIAFFALRARDHQKWHKTRKQPTTAFHHGLPGDRCAPKLCALAVKSLLRNYSPSTVTNSRTDTDDFCNAVFSSAVSLI